MKRTKMDAGVVALIERSKGSLEIAKGEIEAAKSALDVCRKTCRKLGKDRKWVDVSKVKLEIDRSYFIRRVYCERLRLPKKTFAPVLARWSGIHFRIYQESTNMMKWTYLVGSIDRTHGSWASIEVYCK